MSAKSKKKRPPNRAVNGEYRNHNKVTPAETLEREAIARWTEVHALKLRCFSMTFEQIAEHLTRAIRGEVVPAVDPVGAGPWLIIRPQPNRTVALRTAWVAYQRITSRQPAQTVAQARGHRIAQIDRVILSLQPPLAK